MAILSRSIRAGLVLAALGLAACTAPSWKNASYDEAASAHYPVAVTPEMRTLRLAYRGPGAGLSDDASLQLKQFLRDYVNHGNGVISVAAPRGSEAASRGLADEIVAQGVARNNILLATDDMAEGGDVKITYIRYVAQTPPCGDWSENLAQTTANTPPPNMGCAIQHNIAAMVADPRDFVAPDPIGPADAQRALTILDKYRKGDSTPATKTEEQSGAVSDVGKN